MNPSQLSTEPLIKHDKIDDDDSDDSDVKPARRSGRRKIKIEYIEDKNRRHITFSKRKAGIMKKAYELSTLTGTQVLLLVVSETGLVYTFTTVKLQPIVTKPEGKNLIQTCLNAPDPSQPDSNENESTYSQIRNKVEKKMDDVKVEPPQQPPQPPQQQQQQQQPPVNHGSNYNNSSYPYPPSNNNSIPNNGPTTNYGHPTYMNYPPQTSPSSQHSSPYAQMPTGFYGNQPQQPYMAAPHPGYWNNNMRQEDDKRRGNLPPVDKQ